MVEHEEMIVEGRLHSPDCEIRVERFGGGGVQADQPALAELGLADDKSVRCDIGQPQGHGFAPSDPGRGDETQHVVPGERRDRPVGPRRSAAVRSVRNSCVVIRSGSGRWLE